MFCAGLVVMSGMGCGGAASDGPRRYTISGTVTYQGQPIPVGTISFEPDTEKGNSGPGSMADIVNGKYTTPPGKGGVGGSYLARIEGYDGTEIQTGEGVSHTGNPLFKMQTLQLEFPQKDSVVDLTVPAPDAR